MFSHSNCVTGQDLNDENRATSWKNPHDSQMPHIIATPHCPYVWEKISIKAHTFLMKSVLCGCQRRLLPHLRKEVLRAGGFACVYLNRFSWSGLVQKCSMPLVPVLRHDTAASCEYFPKFIDRIEATKYNSWLLSLISMMIMETASPQCQYLMIFEWSYQWLWWTEFWGAGIARRCGVNVYGALMTGGCHIAVGLGSNDSLHKLQARLPACPVAWQQLVFFMPTDYVLSTLINYTLYRWVCISLEKCKRASKANWLSLGKGKMLCC